MRKITREIARAFLNGRSKRFTGNGATETDGQAIWLHGNKIVERREDGIYISDGGWESNTTKERLKPFAQVYHRNHQMFCNGEPWDGSWKRVG